ALPRDARELAAPVLVEHLAAERLLDHAAALRGERLRRRDDRLHTALSQRALPEMRRKQVQRLGVAVEQDRPVAADRLDELLDVGVRDLEGRDEDAPAEERVELLLHHLRA